MPQDVATNPTQTQSNGAGNTPDIDSPLNHLLIQVDDPWYVSLREQIRDVLHPQKLPPLEVTSQPVAVKDIWGEYRYGRVSSLSSLLVHILVLSIILIPVGTKV